MDGIRSLLPARPWTSIVGDRWTLVIVQELLKRTSRYGELMRRLPGMSTTVLTERLRKLEAAGVVERRPGAVGDGVVYALTEKGLALDQVLTALRQWGVEYLTDPAADGGTHHLFDVHYVEGINTLDDAEFGLVIDDMPTTLRLADGHLKQLPGLPDKPDLIVTTTSAFMVRWAAGDSAGTKVSQQVRSALTGPSDAWPRWLAATGYVLRYPGERVDALSVYGPIHVRKSMATHLGGDVKNSCHSAQIPRLGYQYPQLPAGPPMKAESSEPKPSLGIGRRPLSPIPP